MKTIVRAESPNSDHYKQVRFVQVKAHFDLSVENPPKHCAIILTTIEEDGTKNDIFRFVLSTGQPSIVQQFEVVRFPCKGYIVSSDSENVLVEVEANWLDVESNHVMQTRITNNADEYSFTRKPEESDDELRRRISERDLAEERAPIKANWNINIEPSDPKAEIAEEMKEIQDLRDSQKKS